MVQHPLQSVADVVALGIGLGLIVDVVLLHEVAHGRRAGRRIQGLVEVRSERDGGMGGEALAYRALGALGETQARHAALHEDARRRDGPGRQHHAAGSDLDPLAVGAAPIRQPPCDARHPLRPPGPAVVGQCLEE